MKRIHPIEKAIYIYFIGAFALLCILSYLSHKDDKPAGKIIKYSSADERGLISVVYTESGKEWALDYLTQTEFDSLFTNQIKP